jgi:hypothetical protein
VHNATSFSVQSLVQGWSPKASQRTWVS